MAAGGPSRGEVRSLLRSLLREVRAQVTPVANNRLFQERIVAAFRSGSAHGENAPSSSPSPSSSSSSSSAPAADGPRLWNAFRTGQAYLTLLESGRVQKDMWERYGLVAKPDDNRSRLIRNAARVGLRLPPWLDETNTPPYPSSSRS